MLQYILSMVLCLLNCAYIILRKSLQKHKLQGKPKYRHGTKSSKHDIFNQRFIPIHEKRRQQFDNAQKTFELKAVLQLFRRSLQIVYIYNFYSGSNVTDSNIVLCLQMYLFLDIYCTLTNELFLVQDETARKIPLMPP